ncbi:LytR/AlgR family response regulator transcription factor [Christiangramia forsetii]|uniref:Two-component response regulator containing LytTR DNA-binding domain n=2 Tax=Christiangramia forsetii TaxID=411153 RepID=A0M3D4_CHRFK|nr:LytTR family DNA-binding domain-containing protein [Christiangramia forsetii]GGG26105.1 DNA-binding response regulator [Christiangramia forsetii]CAL67129.1 two-component response regulator containing LytTR DNA-binding domain [Christiangramia forsetii KT0803]
MSNKIRCVIVDDENVALDIMENHLSKIDNIELVGRCKNATEAFNMISSNKTDLVFLDINMPGISGISFAKSINKNIKIIFTTAYREYAIDGFDLHAVDYLLKPISFDRLLDAVHNFQEVHLDQNDLEVQNKKSGDFIFVKIDRKMHKIDFSGILWIESLSDYLKIETSEGTKVTRETISSIETKLPETKFLRVHRSFIIAIDYIESYSNEEVVIQNKSIPISRTYKDEVLKCLGKFQ